MLGHNILDWVTREISFSVILYTMLSMICLPLLMCVLCESVTGQQCPDEVKTGPGCSYTCHCANTSLCGETSDCDSVCVPGWRGSTCQQENMARNKITASSSSWPNNGPSRAVDGDKTTRVQFHTSDAANATSAWWRVDLGDVRHVQEVIIYFKKYSIKHRRRGLEFHQSNTSFDGSSRPNPNDACYIVQGLANGSDINDTLSIPQCGGPFRHLMIYSDTSNERFISAVVFDFLEVEVFGCSRGTYGEDCSQFCQYCNSSGCDAQGICLAGCSNETRYGTRCIETCDYCDLEGCDKSGICYAACGLLKQYGERCTETCDNCNSDGCHKNGTCRNAGTERAPKFDNIPVIVGVVVGVLVLCCVAFIFIFYRRRKLPKTNLPDNGIEHKTKTDNVYVNVALENDDGEVTKPVPDVKSKPQPKTTPGPQGKKKKIKTASPTESTSSQSDFERKASPTESADKEPYYNISTAISIARLPDVIRTIKEQDGGFETEFNSLPTGFTAPYEDSQEPHNSGKNRFKGYYPYDHNRVRLSLLPDVPDSDYINASLMHSYNQKKTYIAAQAPKKTTVCDFWRMIWEHGCQLVIMLTGLVEDGKPKCVQYWPGEEQLDTDLHNIHLQFSDVRANYTVRHFKLTLKSTGECRSVVHYHYTSWPDHGVPDTLALVNFIWMIRRNTLNNTPLLVHCSAGIGRTGTYIAVDSLLDQAVDQGVVNVPGYVCVIRGQRKGMIQTKEQYECVFECLLEMTKFGDTSMDVENFTTSYSSRGMDSMVDRKTLREITQMAISGDRNEEGLEHRIWVDGVEDFVVMATPSLRNLHGYLQTVSPSPDQEKLLWKLVEENNVHDVIVISTLENKFYGEVGQTETHGSLLVFTENEVDLNSHLQKVTVHLAVSDLSDSDDSRKVTLLNSVTAPTVEQLSDWLIDVSHLNHVTGAVTPLLIVYSEANRKLALIMTIMCGIHNEAMEDNRVDVIKHVRSSLKCSPGVTITQVDVDRLHEFAMRCAELVTKDKMYANI